MRRLLLALGLLSVVAIGCGSSSDGDVVAQADGFCKTAQADQLKLLDGTASNSKDPKVMKAYLESSHKETEELNGQLRDLTPPSDQKEAWNTWIASLDDQEKASKELIETAKPGMASGKTSPYVTALNEAIAQQVKRNKLASDLGLETCGQNASI